MGKWCRKREEEKVNKGQVYQQKLCRDSGIWGGHWNRSPITAGMVWTRYKDKVHSGKMHCASSTFKSFTYAVKLQPTNTIPQHLITAKCLYLTMDLIFSGVIHMHLTFVWQKWLLAFKQILNTVLRKKLCRNWKKWGLLNDKSLGIQIM